MPLEPLPFDRKGLLKDRKQSSSDPVEIALARCRELPTTPSQHNNHGPSPFCRWGGGGGPSDIRRPFSGHQGKRFAGGWRRVESGSKENNSNASGVSMDFGCQKDSASPNGNSHPHSVFMNSSDQHQSNDQYAKNSGDGVNSHKRLEKENSLGSSLEWKPCKWGRGCGFINSSNCKSHDTKIEAQLGDNTPFGDAVSCVTPRTFDEARSRKKQRLGWGEGLAKYEKKKVDPDDKEAGATHDDVTEPSLPSPCNLSDKSPSLTGFSEYASPTTPYSFACSSSPGVEEKEPIKEVNDTCNPSVVSENHTEGLAFNLEKLEVSQGFNLSSSLDELLQTGDSTSPGSGFAMDKLQVWKALISKKLEITETEIDLLENKLKFSSDAFISFPTKCNNEILEETCGGEKTDSSPEGHSGDEDLDGKSSPDMSTSEFVEPPLNNGDIRSEKAKCSEDLVSDDMLGGESHSCTVSVGGDVHYGREDKLYDSILPTNRVLANTASDELTRLLPTTAHLCTNISETTNDSQIKKKIAMRNRFLKFKERAITLKFRALHYSWKEDLHLLSAKRSGSKSHKKSESSSRGRLSTTDTLDYANKLLSDSRVRVYRNELKMPCLILDRRERMSTRFISDNGLVESPMDVEKERSVLNPWTEKEKEVFLDKYSLFGKDFKKIASFLEHKTIADCVEFYYKNHKSDCFQNAKKKSEFAKRKSCSANTFMVMSGRRSNYETGPTCLEMLGAASAMVEKSDNEQETAAADVLAGICGSISPEALGSCITSSGDVHVRKFDSCSKRQPDETCSDDSCGEDMDLSVWTDEEKASFIKGVRLYGRDFVMISQCVRTRSSDQCRVYFSKARKCLGLDVIEDGSEGGGGTDPEEDKSSCLEEIKVEEAADSENTYSEGSAGEINDDFYALGTKVEADTAPSVSAKEGITESEHGLNGVRDSGSDLNYGSEKVASEKSGDGFLMSNLFPRVAKAVSQENASTRLSFRKSCDKMYQRCSSSSSFLDCVSETKSNFKLDKSLFMPRDLKSVSEEQSSSSCGDVKLFGQILTKKPPQKPRESGEMSSKLNFDGRKVDVDQSLTVKNNISYGFWDGKRIQTGFSYLPDSARLLAKYPAAFSNMSTTSFKFDKQLHYQQQKLNGFCVDKLLLPENVVGDPIRMQYAKREECKKNGEGWR